MSDHDHAHGGRHAGHSHGVNPDADRRKLAIKLAKRPAKEATPASNDWERVGEAINDRHGHLSAARGFRGELPQVLRGPARLCLPAHSGIDPREDRVADPLPG